MSGSNAEFDACFVALSEFRTDARTLNLVETLAKYGKKICVIAIGIEQDIIIYKKKNIELFLAEIPNSGKAWKRWIWFIIKSWKYRRLAVAKNYFAEDVYSLFIAKELARINGGRVFYDSREIYSALGTLFSHPLKQQIITQIERILIKYVDEMIVSGNLDADYLRKYFRHEHPYHVILNLPKYRKPVESNLLREKFGILPEKKIIIYQGMLLGGRGLLPMLKALPYLPDCVFCLLGDGDYKNELMAAARTIGVEDKVHFAGKVPYDELFWWTCSADIGWCYIEPVSLSYRLALPNKLFEYCMAGLPSIVSDLPAMRDILRKHRIGLLSAPQASPEEIAGRVRYLIEETNYLGIRADCLEAAKVYSYESQEKMILGLVK